LAHSAVSFIGLLQENMDAWAPDGKTAKKQYVAFESCPIWKSGSGCWSPNLNQIGYHGNRTCTLM